MTDWLIEMNCKEKGVLFKDWIELVPMERIRKFVTFMIILEDSTVMIETFFI